MIDFHTHILPEMDDGCKSIEESLEVVKMMYANGTRVICATPHYYHDRENIIQFLERRQKCYEILMEAIAKANIKVDVVLGAETAFFKSMSRTDLKKLCYEKTNYLLVEMPFTKWSKEDLEELSKIELFQGITPLLAHIDRYIKLGNKIKQFERLSYPLQVNAEAMLRFSQRRRCMSLLSTRNGVVFGSDCHDRMIRAPNLHNAELAIEKRFGKTKLMEIERTGKIILNLNGESRTV